MTVRPGQQPGPQEIAAQLTALGAEFPVLHSQILER
jgi:hypothetical protein